MNMSIIVAEAVATNLTIILMHGNISLTTLFSGQITESTLDSWLEYFDECYYQEETTVEK